MKKNYKNKQITSETKEVSNKKEVAYSFKGNPPVTVWAVDQKEANKKYKQLLDNKE